MAYKPGSVPPACAGGDGYSSTMPVTRHL